MCAWLAAPAVELACRRRRSAHVVFMPSAQTCACFELQLVLCRTTKLPDIGAVFEKHMKRHNAVAFGLAGDRTQHLLWRLVDGEVGRVWCGCRVI